MVKVLSTLRISDILTDFRNFEAYVKEHPLAFRN